MIKIAVVEDEANMGQMICHQIKQSFPPQDVAEPVVFKCAEEFLRAYGQGYKCHILLTDIELPGMNGIELAKYMRREQPDMKIVFLTSHAEFAAESYELEVPQYILKEKMERRLPEVLKKLADEIAEESGEYICIGNNTSKERICYKDIIYICKEKGRKYAKFVTTKGEYRERTTIDNIMKNLHSRNFIMADRANIVNIKHIIKINGLIISMDDDNEIMVSRNRVQEVKQQISLCWRER